MASFSTAELLAIEGVSVEMQKAAFAAKMALLQVPTLTAYASDGAIAFTEPRNIAKLTKAGVGAYTLAAPTAAQEGYRLLILNQTANAHVVTATNLLDDGVTGGAKDTATFGAFVGASLDLIAINLKWHVVGINICTIAAV
jgi:hypothetical protein